MPETQPDDVETGPYSRPQGGSETAAQETATQETATGQLSPRRVRTVHLQRFKDSGHRFSMLTSYDAMTAEVFDQAGVEVLLVGDSAANVMQGSSSTLSITVDELLVYARSVVNGAGRALVVADLPFGSYEASPQHAVAAGVRFMKEAGVHALKMEGDASMAPHVRAMVSAGIPVMAHVGFTPQAEHSLGGYRVQGRGEARSRLFEDALALQDAGAFCLLVEMVPAPVMSELDEAVRVPTIGIGAGGGATGQVLVWQDMLGLSSGRLPRFVKRYADLRGMMTDAVGRFREDVASGAFPAEEHMFEQTD